MKSLIVMIAATLVATTAVAADPAKHKDHANQTAEQRFDALDRDHDKRLSKSEAQTQETVSAAFESLDKNGDGYVSKSEYTAMTDTGRRSD